jgi:hypothetical protein
MRDEVAIPQSHLWLMIVTLWKNYRDGNGKEPEEKKVQRHFQSGVQLKGRSQGLTLLPRLWSTNKKGPVMTALRKTQQAAERVRHRYLHPTNGQNHLTPVVELGKAERSWGEVRSCRRISSLNSSGPPRSLKHRTTKHAAYTSWYEAPNTHTVEDFRVCVHPEMKHLTLKRLEAQGV